MGELEWCDPTIEDCPEDLETLMGEQIVDAMDAWHMETHFMHILEMNPWGGLAAFVVVGLFNAIVPITYHFVYRNAFDYFQTTLVTAPMYKPAWWVYWITNFILGTVVAVMGVFPFFKMWGDINMYVVGGAGALGGLMGLIDLILYAVAAGQAYGNNDIDTVNTIQREVTMMMAIEAMVSLLLLINLPGWFAGNMMSVTKMWEEEQLPEHDVVVIVDDSTEEAVEDETAVEEEPAADETTI